MVPRTPISIHSHARAIASHPYMETEMLIIFLGTKRVENFFEFDESLQTFIKSNDLEPQRFIQYNFPRPLYWEMLFLENILELIQRITGKSNNCCFPIFPFSVLDEA